jgi:hypothetical protein
MGATLVPVPEKQLSRMTDIAQLIVEDVVVRNVIWAQNFVIGLFVAGRVGHVRSMRGVLEDDQVARLGTSHQVA